MSTDFRKLLKRAIPEGVLSRRSSVVSVEEYSTGLQKLEAGLAEFKEHLLFLAASGKLASTLIASDPQTVCGKERDGEMIVR